MATLATTAFHANSDKRFPKTAEKGAIARSQPISLGTDRADTGNAGPSESAAPYERSVYQPSRRSGPVATIAAAGTVLAIVACMMTLNIVTKHEKRPHLAVMTLRDLDTKPKAAPPPKHLEKTIETPVPAFVPKPEIQLPGPGPVKVALDVPPPPVQVTQVAVPQPVTVDAGASAPASSAAAQEGGDLSGKALFIKPPVYPVEARRRREQGTVKLLVLVGADGRVDDIEIAGSSGSKALDRAALRAVREWRWAPVTRGGTAMAVRGYVTIPFVLVAKNA